MTAAAAVLGLVVAAPKIGRGPATAVLYFIAALVPALGFFNVYFFAYSYVADHFQYLASVGLIALGAAALAAKQTVPPWRKIVGTAIVAIFALLTWKQCSIYASNERLWRDTLDKNPNASIAHTNLANLLTQQRRTAEAISHYREASRLVEDADYEANLANALHGSGSTEEALLHYRRATEIDPGHAYAYHNWGCALIDVGRAAEAIPLFERTLEVQANAAKAHFHWAIALELLGRTPEAVAHYEEAVRLHLENVAASRPITVDPSLDASRYIDLPRAYYLWAGAVWRSGNPEAAVELYRTALRERPGYAEAHRRLGDLYELLGDADRAAQHRAEARRLVK